MSTGIGQIQFSSALGEHVRTCAMPLTVPQFGVYEQIINATEQHSNPFSLLCRVEVHGPVHSDRSVMNVSAFYDGFPNKDANHVGIPATCTRENRCWFGQGDVTTTEAGFQACCDLCTSDPKCKAFAMSNSNDSTKHCHRSYSVPPKLYSDTHDCGLPQRTPSPPTPPPAPSSCTRKKLCWYGMGDVTTTESGFQACCDLCTSDQNCQAFAMSNANDTSRYLH